MRGVRLDSSDQQRLHHPGIGKVCRALVAAMQAAGHALVIEAEQVQDGGVPVGDHDAVFHGIIAMLIIGDSSIELPLTSARQEDEVG
jgi:hypothetical protein